MFHNNLAHNFVNNIAQRNWPKLTNVFKLFNLGDKENISLVNICYPTRVLPQILYMLTNFPTNNTPIFFIKSCRKTIRPRRFPGIHAKQCMFNLIIHYTLPSILHVSRINACKIERSLIPHMSYTMKRKKFFVMLNE